jgi:hypothetical protein
VLVPEYLSEAWLSALDDALRRVHTLMPLTIEQVVTDVPGRGDVRYVVWFDEAGGHAAAHRAGPADVGFRTDYATAVAIAQGRENAQRALAAGRLRLGGEVERLTRHADALAALDDAASAVRAVTTYRGIAIGFDRHVG